MQTTLAPALKCSRLGTNTRPQSTRTGQHRGTTQMGRVCTLRIPPPQQTQGGTWCTSQQMSRFGHR